MLMEQSSVIRNSIKMIETILKRMQTRYSRMLDTYYPSFETTGFTERNLTFNFCHEALCLNEKLIVWQEAPLSDKEQHLDSIIFDDVNKSIYIVEAKRLGAEGAISSIKNDMERLEDLSTQWKKIRGVDDYYVPERKNYKKYFVILVDFWAPNESTEDSVKNLKKYISFTETVGTFGYNQIVGPFKVDGKTLDNQKYFLLCAVKTALSQ